MYCYCNGECLLENTILSICKNEYKKFLCKSNVVGVGLGYKIANGFYINKKCITVFVKKKVSINELNNEDIIPLIYKNISTDVVESGTFKPLSLTTRERPTICGYSIGCVKVRTNGTLGALVTDGKNKFLLTCNHVLTERNTMPLGTKIMQPSLSDHGKENHDVIAQLSKYIPIMFITKKEEPENEVDCAMGKLISPTISSAKIAFVGYPLEPKNVKINDSVMKTGRTTEYTKGTVTNVGSSIELDFGAGDVAIFENQVITSHMASVGDSGSLVVDKNKHSVGLLGAGTECFSIFTPIKTILNKLKVKLVIRD